MWRAGYADYPRRIWGVGPCGMREMRQARACRIRNSKKRINGEDSMKKKGIIIGSRNYLNQVIPGIHAATGSYIGVEHEKSFVWSNTVWKSPNRKGGGITGRKRGN